jgi:hypothetical protein
VPPNPKLLTLARRTPVPGTCGHGIAAVGTDRYFVKAATFGLRLSRCMFGGKILCFSARDVLRRPAIPAAPSRWPMTVLIPPTERTSELEISTGVVSSPKKALLIASASRGSLFDC